MWIPILTYHRVILPKPTREVDPARIAVSADQFRSHLVMLKRLGYKSIGLNTYAEHLAHRRSLPYRTVAITFDDGYEDNLTIALPLLKTYGFTATVFAVTGHVGGTNVWDGGGLLLLSREGWKALRQAGIDIGAHTVNHPHLTQLPIPEAEREIRESREQTEELVGEKIPTFAYPYGETNEAVDGAAKRAGAQVAFATDRAEPTHDRNPYRLRRIVIFPKTTALQVAWKVQRFFPYYQDWKRGHS